MRYFHKLKNKFHCPTINLDKIWTLVPEGFQGIPSIDVTKAGYFKVGTTLAARPSTDTLPSPPHAKS